jgi:hypothetical protein
VCLCMKVHFLFISHDYIKLCLCFINQAAARDVVGLRAEPQAVGAPALAWLSTCNSEQSYPDVLRHVCHPLSTKWAPMRHEWPWATVFLSDSAGHRFGRVGQCVCFLGHVLAGCCEPQASTGLELEPTSASVSLGQFL